MKLRCCADSKPKDFSASNYGSIYHSHMERLESIGKKKPRALLFIQAELWKVSRYVFYLNCSILANAVASDGQFLDDNEEEEDGQDLMDIDAMEEL